MAFGSAVPPAKNQTLKVPNPAPNRRLAHMYAEPCLFFCVHFSYRGLISGDDDDDDADDEEHAKPSLLCVLLQPTTTYITKEK